MPAQLLKPQTKSSNPVFSEKKLTDLNSITRLLSFTIKDFLFWWYYQMPLWYLTSIRRVSTVINDRLSLSLLLKTFFVPWHRDNSFVGYFIGIIMRILYLPVATIIYLTMISTYILFFIFWLIIPLTTIFFIITTPAFDI